MCRRSEIRYIGDPCEIEGAKNFHKPAVEEASMDISNFIAWLVGSAVSSPGEKVKPSIGQRLLPAKFRRNKNAIIAANILIWTGIVAACVIFVVAFSG